MKNKTGVLAGGGKYLTLMIGAGAMLFTAFHSYNFLTLSSPKGAEWLPFVGLALLDFGLIGWYVAAGWSHRSDEQKTIAVGMVVVEIIFIGVTVLADVLLTNQIGVQTPEYLKVGALYGVVALAVIHLVAFALYELMDPDMKTREAERAIDHAIMAHMHEKMFQDADSVAREVAPEMARHKEEELKSKYRATHRSSAPSFGPAPMRSMAMDAERAPEIASGGNGKLPNS